MAHDSLTVRADTAEKVRELRDRRDTTLDEVVTSLLDEAGEEV
jgi:hypothetical protein